MVRVAAIAALLFNAATASAISVSSNILTAKARPAAKVVSLLQDMLKQLEKDAEEDKAIYDKLACWCETNEKEKTKSISEAEARIGALGSEIDSLAAASSRLSSEIKALEKEVSANQKSLEEATALRQKQTESFNAEEKDMLSSISSLKAAVTVLNKHSLLQKGLPRTHILSIAATLERVMMHHSEMLSGVLTHSDRQATSAFIQAAAGDAASQSGEILGVLKSMQDTFESNLSTAQKEEQKNQKAFEELRDAKRSELEAGKAQIDAKTSELADTDDKHARAKQDLEDTRKSLTADQAFLANLRETCANSDAEWEERQKSRALEIEACSKALTILTSDDARDLLSKNFNPSLLQRQSSSRSLRRAKASAVLSALAKKHHSSDLAALAARVKLDAFEKVKEAITEMVNQLLKDKADEIKHKDYCVAEFNNNKKQTEDAERTKEAVTAKIADLDKAVKALAKSIKELKAEVAEMQFQFKRASENRESENKVFQESLADQRATQQLLDSALKALTAVYGKLLQAKARQPEGFSEYKKNALGGGVVELLKSIIADSKAAEAETIRSEEDAQKAYEDFVKETNTSIEAKTNEIVNKSETKAKTEADLVAAKEALEGVQQELDQLAGYKEQLHASCDFVLKNFELRQTTREEEVEGLRQAMAILSGAKF